MSTSSSPSPNPTPPQPSTSAPRPAPSAPAPTFDKATLYTLSQPEKLSDVLAAEDKYDCFSCRLTGGVALLGLGAYTYLSTTAALNTPDLQKKIAKSGSRFGVQARKRGVLGLSMCLWGVGVWRMVR
ncbi:MAG: hypothetical protein LQ350_004750 [Teloschistes chrysophthalmus]|nr:MAG: hypothetical protein LQ350_004750 [Niorma chrysophthalma]